MTDTINPSVCVCGATSTNTCARCGVEKYCGRDCQVRHWPKHKRFCITPAARLTARTEKIERLHNFLLKEIMLLSAPITFVQLDETIEDFMHLDSIHLATVSNTAPNNYMRPHNCTITSEHVLYVFKNYIHIEMSGKSLSSKRPSDTSLEDTKNIALSVFVTM